MILFELNARLHRRTLDELADEHLDRLAALGFDWIWLMGIWRIGAEAIAISLRYGEDFVGSPYAIADYEVTPDLGGEPALRRFVERAHALGIKVMVDFVPNHQSVDSPLLDAHPDYAIHWNPDCRDAFASDYFDHPKGRLAHGKDPYFAGWTDTVQLDYSHPPLRAHQIRVLEKIAGLVDGVRCDMAMLVLRDQIQQQWFPRIDRALFDRHFPEEFWSEAIRETRAVHPGFVFMAEVYWGKEPYLQELGFDVTYDKALHDLMAWDKPAEEIAAYLARSSLAYVERSVHFLENHDEERAAVRFGRRQRPSAVLSFALPGAVFIHQGEMEGLTEKLPVQRVVPLRKEEPDRALARFYERLLAAVRDPVVRVGDVRLLGVQHGVILLLRRHEGAVVLVGASPTGPARERSPALTLDAATLGAPDGQGLRLRDRLGGGVIEVTRDGAQIFLPEGAIAGWAEAQAFLIEAMVG